jgi:hypothetical protein
MKKRLHGREAGGTPVVEGLLKGVVKLLRVHGGCLGAKRR